MQVPFHHTQSKLVHSKVKTQKAKFYDFFSHKQRIPVEIKSSKQEKFKYQQELKYLIHQWMAFETSLNYKHQISQSARQYYSMNAPNQRPQKQNQSSRIQQQIQNPDKQILSEQLIQYICQHHPIFKRINFNLAQTLINIGVFAIYPKGTEIPYVYYDQKNKNQCNQKKKLGIVMYGRFRLSNKIESFDKIIDENDSLGEHGLETLAINFPDYRNVKVKSIDNQTAVLWIKKENYEILFKESMKCGLKQELKKFQSHLKLSWIKKSIRKL